MRTTLLARTVLVVLAAVALLAASPAAGASSNHNPLFDFTDAFYKSNGVKPAAIVGRANGADGISTVDQAPDRQHRDVRMLLHIAAYDHSGGLRFWSPAGSLNGDGFTNDDAGRKAKALAESSKIWL